jgi:hypothetical protein
MSDKKILKVTHNAGFFSCSTLRLVAIMMYYNEHGYLPDEVDSTEQWAFYKEYPEQNLVPLFFDTKEDNIPFTAPRMITYEPREVSFTDYSKLLLENTSPFVDKYFSPSSTIQKILDGYEMDYGLDYCNLCGIFYRGNDKKRECDIVPYQQFIEKAHEILSINPDVKFLVQPDETEFLEAFTTAFPGKCIWFKETPHMRKKDSAIFYELPLSKRPEHGCYFLAATIALSKCEYLVTHSGNGGMWAVLYRNNYKNVHQFITNHIY